MRSRRPYGGFCSVVGGRLVVASRSHETSQRQADLPLIRRDVC
jgi:hypothetical protein